MASGRTIGVSPQVLGGVFNRYGSERAAWQWQPVTYGTSASHDPNPPITIDTFVPPAGGSTVPVKAMMGLGF